MSAMGLLITLTMLRQTNSGTKQWLNVRSQLPYDANFGNSTRGMNLADNVLANA